MTGIRQETIDHIRNNIHRLEIDIEGGVIKNRFMKRHGKEGNNYYTVQLSGKQVKVHHIIAFAGGLPLEAGKVINHMDLDRFNNRLENLEVVTVLENTRHAVENGRFVGRDGEGNGNARLNANDVRQIRVLLAEGHKIADIGRMFGVSDVSISNIRTGKTWKGVS